MEHGTFQRTRAARRYSEAADTTKRGRTRSAVGFEAVDERTSSACDRYQLQQEAARRAIRYLRECSARVGS